MSYSTDIILRPNGVQALVIPKIRVDIVEGPGAGQAQIFEQERILIGSGEDCDLRLADTAVSRRHLEIRATRQGHLLRDLDSKNGAHLAGVRLVQVIINGPVVISIGTTRLQLVPLDERVELLLSGADHFGSLLGRSPAMRRVFAILERAAVQDTAILLEGETGTGKELCAQAIHDASPRRDGPFVVVDCGAIPPQLIESELFGHLKGSFTDAVDDRPGAVENADGGTLFLDEVGELELELQPRLLRFLERREVKRVGAQRARRVDVRIIAGTHRKLSAEVASGAMRKDLFYRLSVLRIELPPLRDRPEDIVPLAEHFCLGLGVDPEELLGPSIVAMLTSHHWPGNIRELRNIIERLHVLPEQAGLGLSAGGRVEPDLTIGALADLPFHEARRRWVDRFEKQYLTVQLKRVSGVVSWAASVAELSRQTFHRMLRHHGLRKD